MASAAPQLPTELIALIIELSLPSPLIANFPARATLLCALALVSPSFRALAQASLFEFPVIRSANQGVQLLNILESQPWRTEQVVGMAFIGSYRSRPAASSCRAWQLLEACPSVRDLRFQYLQSVRWERLACALREFTLRLPGSLPLTLPQDLEQLILYECDIVDDNTLDDEGHPIPPAVFPCLVHLSLFLRDSEIPPLLSSTSLPKLRTLGLCGGEEREFPEDLLP